MLIACLPTYSRLLLNPHICHSRRTRDTDWFSVIDKEWPRLRSAFERWLAVENFDAEGKQRTTLAACMEA